MKTVEITEAAASLAKYAVEAGSEAVLLTADGEPVAVLMGLEGIDMETIALSNNPKFIALIEKSRARYKAEGGRRSDDVRRRLKLGANRTG